MIWLLLIVLLILGSTAFASLSLIVWVPTKQKDLDRILTLANLQPGEKFIDLGSGTGTVPCFLAKNTQAAVTGVELALPFYLIAKIRQLYLNVSGLKIVWGNLFNINLAGYDVIYVFGIPDKLQNKLKPKLEQELKPGARVMSYAFTIKGWEPTQVSKPEKDSVTIYLYQR